MKKNLPYFLVIAALIFLIVAVLSSGQKPQTETQESAVATKEKVVAEKETPLSLTQNNRHLEAAPQEMGTPVNSKIFKVYSDKSSPDNHYAPSGWMGDFGDVNLNDQYMDNCHAGTTCIQITYSAKMTQGAGWAGIFWQNPPNNWGERKGGFDLTGYNKLTFWARGEMGGEAIEKFKVGGVKGTYPDSLEVEMGPVVLTDEWQQYTINLSGRDLSYVSGGFCWVTASRLNPNGATFYLDDIRFEYEPGLKAQMKMTEQLPFNVYTERSSADNHFIASGWMGDYGDLRIDEAWTADPHSGTTCVRVVYSGKVSQGARWAGIFWQNPPNNWGAARNAGYDLSKATKLTFWARGEAGGERVEEFKMGGISGDYPDSDVAGVGPVVLTPQWQQYTIDLAGKDLSYIIGGFCFSTNVDVNPEGATFYLDDIRYE
ncbi:MAG: hypothetical protein JW714_01505 [Candidatus Omnitrophica bacterium]|nr:hypothetical protein [Candidatus Omnitrophota bacterium]